VSGSLPRRGTEVWGIGPEAEPAFARVVFVTIDTLRADHLACYGYFRSTSPFLDRLAERSLVFESAMSASSHTAPSHASMFTGLPPGLHGLLTNGSVLPPEVTTLAESFRTAGYETAAFTSVEFLEGIARGFDHVRARTTKAEGISNAAISWLRKERGSDRFLLWLHYYDPHRWKMPDRVPPGRADAVRASTTIEPEDVYQEVARRHGLPIPFAPAEWRLGDKGEEVTTTTQAEILAWIDSYDAQIAYADDQIRRVYESLEELELSGETLWIVTADHGEGLGSHGYAGHGWQVYQEQLRVPLIVHGSAGSIPARRFAGLVSLVDLFPTLIDLLGGTVSGELAEWTGRSLRPLLAGEELPGVAYAFAQRRPLRTTGGDGVFALLDGRHKLVLRTTGDDELFDLRADPLERVNVLPSGGEELARLRAELQRTLAAIGTQGLASEEGAEEWLEELQKLGYAR